MSGVFRETIGLWTPTKFPNLEIPVKILRKKQAYGRINMLIQMMSHPAIGGGGTHWVSGRTVKEVMSFKQHRDKGDSDERI